MKIFISALGYLSCTYHRNDYKQSDPKTCYTCNCIFHLISNQIMATETLVNISIGGYDIPVFQSLTLDQEIDAHHQFELVCRKDVLETNSDELLGESKEFLGQLFTLEIQTLNGYADQENFQFKGIVSGIHSVKGFHHHTGDLIKIKGKSCSIIADDGPNYASHTDLGLTEILEKTFAGYNKAVLRTVINPEKTDAIHYSVQHDESAFQYASRLASQYGEWFYYNGNSLIFGKPERKEAVSLLYGHNLIELAMNLEPVPNQFKYFTNDYLSDSYHEKKTKDIAQRANGINSFVSAKSEALYPKETQVFVSAHDDVRMKARMDHQITKQKLSHEINQVKISGISTNPQVHLGSIVNIEEDGNSHGEYRVVKIAHSCGENGRYENEFEAVTAEIDVYPKTSIKSFPKSKVQTAVVVDNVDPQGMGRVKVQYAWQKPTGATTGWIRQSNPAGGAGQGIHFVPEKGDEVIMTHEGGNAEAPIVQGNVTNASSVPESFQSDNNHLKAIRTRSGNQVTLNDNDGSVTIADPSGNTIVMAGNGEITVNAPNKITFSSKDIAVEASNDFTVNAGNNISSTAAKEMAASAGTDFKMDAGTAMSIEAKDNLDAKAGKKASFKGNKSVTIFGKRVSITGAVMTNIQSGTILTVVTAGVLNLFGGASSLVNGAKVKILGGKVNIN